jgi:hypothetical protein
VFVNGEIRMKKTPDVYRVETVETSKAPRGVAKGEWCRYVVANTRSRIVGRYQGTLVQARRNAERLAKGLNERASSGKSPWVPRGRAQRANAQTRTHS